ncbi:MAG: Ig-like domain-containing protein, partial [Planctomycetes bacterium]|nr:Ig-like domain-containing protein [Planctomycetota bacterium]
MASRFLIGSLLLVTAIGCNPTHSHVVSMTPESGSTIDDPPTEIAVRFDRAMDPSTIDGNTFVVEGSVRGGYDGAVTYDPLTRTAFFRPTTAFDRGEQVMVSLTRSIQSSSDKELRPFRGEFHVRAPEVYMPPPMEVLSIDPVDGTVGVAALPSFQIHFSAIANPFTVTAETVHVFGSRSGAIEPTFPNLFLGGDTLTVQLSRSLLAGERVTLELGGGLASTEGAELLPVRFGFTAHNTAPTTNPTSVSSASIDIDGRVVFLDADGDARDEWVAVHTDGRLEAQELIVDAPSAIEVQILSEGVADVAVGDFDGDGRA